MKTLATLLLAGSFSLGFMTKNQTNNEFVMCIVHGEYDQKKGFELASEFKTKEGASVCRLDHTSKKFFAVFETGKVTRDEVIDFFATKGMKATCAVFGKHGVDTVPDLDSKECK